jgi:branched-chain amino acid transport system substrate-binding protein
MRNRFRFCVLAVVAALVLGACGTAPSSAPPAAAPDSAVTTAPPATDAPNAAAPEEAAQELTLGAIHPLSGSLAQDGAFLQNGIDLAVEEINAAGRIACLNGATLRVEHADSQGKPEVGQSEAERLIGEGAVALLGTYQSSVTLNATQVAEREQTPFLVTVAVANAIMERDFQYTFRIQPDQTQMTLGLLEALQELRETSGQPIATAVMLHEDSLFGTGFADLLKEYAPQYGLEVIGDVPYAVQGLTDLTTELARVQALDPDITVVTGYLNDGILVARTAQELRLASPLVGLASGAFSTQQFVDQIGPDANLIMDANYHYDATNPRAREVRDAYKARFDSDMPTHGVMAYQSVYILKDALERACSTDGVALREALAATNYADHILPYQGPITFDATGQVQDGRAVLMQVQDGQIVQVGPQALAEQPAIFPPPQP